MNKVFKIPTAIIFLALLNTSCSTLFIRKPLKEIGVEGLIERVDEKQFKFNTLETDFTASLNSKTQNIDFKGQLRIEENKVIWLSISAILGVEMARIKITPDSVFFINRVEKTYLAESISEFEKLAPVLSDSPFEILQNIFVGNAVMLFDITNYKTSIDDREYKISSGRQFLRRAQNIPSSWEQLTQSFWINPRTFRITRMDIKDKNKEENVGKIKLKYSNFEELGKQRLPLNIELTLFSNEKTNIKIHYSVPEVNETVSFPFKISNKYKEIQRNQETE